MEEVERLGGLSELSVRGVLAVCGCGGDAGCGMLFYAFFVCFILLNYTGCSTLRQNTHPM